jgi:hypothetical protein
VKEFLVVLNMVLYKNNTVLNTNIIDQVIEEHINVFDFLLKNIYVIEHLLVLIDKMLLYLEN